MKHRSAYSDEMCYDSYRRHRYILLLLVLLCAFTFSFGVLHFRYVRLI